MVGIAMSSSQLVELTETVTVTVRGAIKSLDTMRDTYWCIASHWHASKLKSSDDLGFVSIILIRHSECGVCAVSMTKRA